MIKEYIVSVLTWEGDDDAVFNMNLTEEECNTIMKLEKRIREHTKVYFPRIELEENKPKYSYMYYGDLKCPSCDYTFTQLNNGRCPYCGQIIKGVLVDDI